MSQTMSYGNIKERGPSFLYSDEKLSDVGRFGTGSSQVSPPVPQSIVFPYVGPPGSGPGLLGTRPGSGGTEYLAALEHHAASLKSALQVVAALKNQSDEGSSVESDPPCDAQSEHKKHQAVNKASDFEENVLCKCSSSEERQNSSLVNTAHLEENDVLKDHFSTNGILINNLMPHIASGNHSHCDTVEDETSLDAESVLVMSKCKTCPINEDNVLNVENCDVVMEKSEFTDLEKQIKVENKLSVECNQGNNPEHYVIYCSKNGAAGDGNFTAGLSKKDLSEDAEESSLLLKRKALRTARNALREFQKLMREQELNPQRKAVDGVLGCLACLCKDESLWSVKDDFVVSLEIPL